MVEVDTVLDLLHEKRRRYTLYYLKKQSGPVSIDEVAEAVAEMEANPHPDNIPDEEFRSLEIELRHNHLPKANSVDFITYNEAENTVELTDNPSTFDTILTVANVLERPDG